MIDTSGIEIIKKIRDKKQSIIQRLVLDANPLADESKYTYNTLLKMLLVELNAVVEELITGERIYNNQLLQSSRIKQKTFELREKELKDISDTLHTITIHTKKHK